MTTALEDLNALSLPDLYGRLSAGGLVRRLIGLMRDEDLGTGDDAGDITANASAGVSDRAVSTVEVRTRASGVVAGLAAIPDLLEVFAPHVSCEALRADGVMVDEGDALARLSGPTVELHVIERPLLNLVGRLSGVATRTAAFVRAVRDATDRSVAVLDTRKTTPGMRVLEKYAVRCGGGSCHRIGLFDAVLVKDNHLAGVATDALASHVQRLAEEARSRRPLRFVEVEVDTLGQLDALLMLPAGVLDVVMLDNMTTELLREAVARRDERQPSLLLESSGGVSLETIGGIARSGVDRISVGSLTHGATWLDVGMDAV